MMRKALVALLVGVATTAVARGIVLAFGFDKAIAQIFVEFSVFAASRSEVLAWLGSGAVGLIAIVVWHLSRADERLRNMWSPSPRLGSLSFVRFDLPLARNISTNVVRAELVCVLRNSNDALMALEGKLWGNLNGQAFTAPNGADHLPFSSVAHPAQESRLILRMHPIQNPSSQSIPLQGHMRYEVSYYFQASPSRRRFTAKTIDFNWVAPLTGVPGTHGHPINVLFLDSQER